MSSLYLRNGVYYLNITIEKKRYRRCLKTTNKNTAKRIANQLIPSITKYHWEGFEYKIHSFEQLVDIYLSSEHEWSSATFDMNNRALRQYLKNGMPTNPNSRAIYKNRINMCVSWGLKNGIKTNHPIYSGREQRSIPRTRVFSSSEIKKITTGVQPEDFNRFVRFSYYTGARRGEINHLLVSQIHADRIEVNGKTGLRLIKLNKQAQAVLMEQDTLWDYKLNYITHKFKKEIRRLEIYNGRFHDLRRTFGLNLIKNGIPIYHVSKLLGHSSVTVTEKHYAPLLATQIEDFIL